LPIKKLKQRLGRNFFVRCIYFLATDFLAGLRHARGAVGTDSGTRHASLSPDASLAYIERAYEDYLRYGDIGGFAGTVGELGPGDNFGVALLAMRDGAERYIAVDRFYSQRDHIRQRQIYRSMAEQWHLANLFDGDPSEENIRSLDYVYGMPAEQFFHETDLRFDYIVSRAVLEHLMDPTEALDGMARRLDPNGQLIHRVDLRDHGMFPDRHPLTFLTIPTCVYRHMVKRTGRPNRMLLSSYRDWLAASPLEGDIRITRLVGVATEYPALDWDDLPQAAKETALGLVQKIRPRLARSFRTEADCDLAVSGFVLTARHPKAVTAETNDPQDNQLN
jgi:SAM-dependent methyltransferase